MLSHLAKDKGSDTLTSWYNKHVVIKPGGGSKRNRTVDTAGAFDEETESEGDRSESNHITEGGVREETRGDIIDGMPGNLNGVQEGFPPPPPFAIRLS